ncbi:MAG: hypothetical protein J0H92_10250 [Sphingobacteriales bacterium]|jgi:hypothetical protein|nr:hypothetical protein [Sphingobacteriales bacterium]MBP7554622.1 hypothetical protein [Chitinophagaceae bacterium]NCT74593.1 hypothetical protein [Chitinophagaceae bacterium]OJW32373.1 MAG: hypothetical protein BGO54_18415 [Sphingobacteriales bacterium 46-32]
MKLKHALLAVVLMSAALFAQAQPGGQRRTVEERVKMVHEKIDSAFKLDADKLAKVDAAFTKYYKDQDKLREEMMSGGERPDFQAMREKMQPLTDARDKELKTILTDEQFKKWKEEIEPAMMPRRGGGGGNRQ